jgi:uncharacterized protein (DUF58 family)
MTDLFNDAFIHAISLLRIRSRRVPPGGRHGEHRSLVAGSGMEFRDFRSYVPGDDIRRVDWNLYRRSGRLFLRLFEELMDLPVYVLLDTSDSMFFEEPPRADAARQMAAVMAGVSLNQLDRTGIYPFGRDLSAPFPVTSDKAAFQRLLRYLEALGPAGETDLGRAMQRFAASPLRSGLVVLISDFFDPRGVDHVIESLCALRHRLLLVQVARASDASPGVEGEVRLVDCESGGSLELTVDPGALLRYQEAYRSFQEALLRFAARRRAFHVRLDADRPVIEQLHGLFRNGVFET